MGSTLFWRGRFVDALRWLPPSRERGWTLARLGQRDAALDQPQDAALHFYLDEPETCLKRLGPADTPIEAARMELLRYWANTRLAEPADEARAHWALATLRRMAPSEEARGLAVYAEAAFRRHPVHALAHLDHALERFARFGLHHLEERLLEHKACALEASGMLAEAERFRHAAAEVTKRQR